ncbi:hypothetical protein BN000_05543 [Mycobacterium rhizamassiliense]|uniref:Uncharacterized protein n=1 Tax=Mycobacterium rhizamassiliense TaxID=1841860 RepID=A0A2U3NWF2_9MYCO|nr:hypothetical protein [Mycobacterium rhizamassiliense]SPM35785.1 hypothetical protein BN000_05543 [Mycobacterium rhizamassiliense]
MKASGDEITGKPKIRRCSRCGRRMRNPNGWNAEMIAGIAAGYLCPGCQTVEEDLDAELNLTLGRSAVGKEITVNSHKDLTTDVLTGIVDGLVRTYPTPEVMRDKANRLAAARGDRFWMVGVMRMAADGMASGPLFDG